MEMSCSSPRMSKCFELDCRSKGKRQNMWEKADLKWKHYSWARHVPIRKLSGFQSNIRINTQTHRPGNKNASLPALHYGRFVNLEYLFKTSDKMSSKLISLTSGACKALITNFEGSDLKIQKGDENWKLLEVPTLKHFVEMNCSTEDVV